MDVVVDVQGKEVDRTDHGRKLVVEGIWKVFR